MRALVQRVTEASVRVDQEVIGSIDSGLLVLLGIHKSDIRAQAEKLSNSVLQARIFCDAVGKMNQSVLDRRGGLLVVSQFTLYGDTSRGRRPSYSEAAAAEKAVELYEYFVTCCRCSGLRVETGRFQAMMQVHLVNDGPVTLLFETKNGNPL